MSVGTGLGRRCRWEQQGRALTTRPGGNTPSVVPDRHTRWAWDMSRSLESSYVGRIRGLLCALRAGPRLLYIAYHTKRFILINVTPTYLHGLRLPRLCSQTSAARWRYERTSCDLTRSRLHSTNVEEARDKNFNVF